jgi:hypothetical protein
MKSTIPSLELTALLLLTVSPASCFAPGSSLPRQLRSSASTGMRQVSMSSLSPIKEGDAMLLAAMLSARPSVSPRPAHVMAAAKTQASALPAPAPAPTPSAVMSSLASVAAAAQTFFMRTALIAVMFFAAFGPLFIKVSQAAMMKVTLVVASALAAHCYYAWRQLEKTSRRK